MWLLFSVSRIFSMSSVTYFKAVELPTPPGSTTRIRPAVSIYTVRHTDDVYHRHFQRVSFRYCVRRILRYQADGVTPAELKICRDIRRYIFPVFEPGQSTFEGEGRDGKKIRVRMLNEEGEAVTSAPYYIELEEPSGDRFRMYASGGPNRPFGSFTSWHSASGEVRTLADFGITVFTDEKGALTQVRSSENLHVFEDLGGERYRKLNYDQLDKIPDEPKSDGYTIPEGLIPIEDTILENPDPHSSDFIQDVTRYRDKEEVRRLRWTKNPIGDYDLAHYDENWELIYEQHARWYNEDRSRFYRLNGTRLQDGTIRSTLRTRGVIAGRWMDLERRVETGDEVDVTTYHYYEEPASRRHKPWITQYGDGRWEAFDYDAQGRLEIELRPIATTRQVVEFVEEEPAEVPPEEDLLSGLFEAFTDGAPAGKRRVVRTVTDYHPVEAPHDIRASLEQGEVTRHEFIHPDPSVIRADTESRPAVTTLHRNGVFVERSWFTYDVERNGRRMTITETSTNPDASFGDPKNRHSSRW